MSISYLEELNNLYTRRILIKENVGLGPKTENYEAPIRSCKCGKVEGEDAEECCCMIDKKKIKSEDDIVLARKETQSEYDDYRETGEHPVEKASNMVKQNLYRITKMSAMLYDIIPCDSEIEPWISDKISKAVEGINSALSYKDYEEFKQRVDHDIEIEEKTEQDLYSSIDNGGVDLINKIKEIMQTQPKERVEGAVYSMIKMLEA
ncbi:hypothetical protein UFOVP760_191 [uncultured Caudovirales phage]|uniref:Uncharacterized protein n=1 Tax=uncultured Caudovirales phage TaxID=2100421 RepID=A0A6J7XF09_9CAUD|nr:hypothetical protein UFOVP760_191 [uncultured Caudovirales phage]